MPLPIVWVPVLQAGAEALAEGLGRRLGESLGGAAGTAIAKLIFGAQGSTADAWQSEVSVRLVRIEQKLDVIIAFIQNQLPALVYKAAEQAVINQRIHDINAARVTVLATFRAYESQPNDPARKGSLEFAANRIAEMGLSLAENGPAYHAACLVAFTTMYSAYCRLIAENNGLLSSFLTYVADYNKFAITWLDPQRSASLAEVINAKKSEFDQAKHIIDQQPLGNFLLAVFAGPIDTSSIGGVSTDTYWGMKAWVDPIKAGMWNGDWGGGEQRTISVPKGTQMDPAIFVQNMPPNIRWKSLDFIDTPMPPISKSGMGDHFGKIISRINEAQRLVNAYPQRKEELYAAYYATQGMQEACGKVLALQAPK